MRVHHWRRAVDGLLFGLLVLSAAVGCGGPFTAEVSGTVKYNGDPLHGGMVTIAHPDGRVAKGQIQEDGTYRISNAPGGGEVKVSVHTEKPIPPMPAFVPLAKAGTKAETIYPAGKYVKIPDKYTDPDKSGLKLTIHRGSQPFDIEMTD